MNKIVIVLSVIFALSSCSNKSELSKEFNCTSSSFENLKIISDFKKNFRLKIPENWRTRLYYDNYSSDIHTADTTKQLSETFILSTSYRTGNVFFDDKYIAKNDSILKSNNLTTLKAEKIKFQHKESYFYLVKGVKNNFPYQQINITIKTSNNSYFNAFVDVYGESNVNERICQAISLINKVEFLQ